MRTDLTLAMIKPDAVKNGHTGAILDHVIKAGFEIVAMKYTRLSLAEAASFYDVHKNRPFFEPLVNFMSSGPIVAVVLKKADAVDGFRALIGSTNPAEAAEGTIRRKYAESLERNAVHGSDSSPNAEAEMAFHFSKRELFEGM